MNTDYIALAVPAFFLLIAIEVLVSRARGLPYYRLNDSISDVSTGVLQQLATLLLAGFMIAGYLALYAHTRVMDWPANSAWTWIVCFVGVDLLYYWFHRLSHEINFMWAAHVVHHQSEEYNLTVALRQSALQPFLSMVFYWPLAWLGFPPAVFAACASFNTLYQFWIHTRTIGRLGPLEAVLMTPSHHRVHHGRNPIYIDRNHGGTLILWDKLFGTFESEAEEVAFGITKPLASWNPLWANAHYWIELHDAARRTRRWRDKLLVFLMPPGWMPDDLGGFQPPPPVEASDVLYDPSVPRRLAGYAAVQYLQLLGLSSVLIFAAPQIQWTELFTGAAVVCWGLVNMGGVFDRAPWTQRSEWLRLLATPVFALWMWPDATGGMLAAGLAANTFLAHRLGLRWSTQLASAAS